MTARIAFFPWLRAPKPLTLGPVRLIPYERGAVPAAIGNLSQADLDRALNVYHDPPGDPLESAVFIEVDQWRLGQPVDLGVEQRLALAREALCFSALAGRRLFCPHHTYCNADNFRLVTAPVSGQVAYRTRRRDGAAMNGWGEDEFAFRCPLHVHKEILTLDMPLALLVLSLSQTRWVDAVVEFNLSNTDSPDVALHSEMVMMKSAFERLLNIETSAVAFSDALEDHLRPYLASPPADGDMVPTWQQIRPRSPTLLDAWARDFCAARGTAAHGSDRKAVPLAWSQEAHLAYASVMFPLVFKVVVAKAANYRLTEGDHQRLSYLEWYLAYQPFYPMQSVRETLNHPWFKIEQRIDA